MSRRKLSRGSPSVFDVLVALMAILFWCLVPLLWVLCPNGVLAAESVVSITRGDFTYFFDNPYYIGAAHKTLEDTRVQLQSLLRDSLSFPVEVYMVESSARFDSLMGGKFPEWGAAAAIPHRQWIVIKSPDSFNVNKSIEELLAHEYTHLALAHRTGLYSPPRWFDEGLAVLVSMEWGWTNSITMSLATITGGFIPLEEIEHVNRFGGNKARLAYTQSYLAVQYMFEYYGVEGVNVFLDSLARAGDPDNALMASTGSNYADFEAELRVYLREKFNLVSLFMDTMYFWLALAVVLIIGAILKLSKRRAYYRKWEEDERLASTDLDYGDPDRPEHPDDDEPWRP